MHTDTFLSVSLPSSTESNYLERISRLLYQEIGQTVFGGKTLSFRGGITEIKLSGCTFKQKNTLRQREGLREEVVRRDFLSPNPKCHSSHVSGGYE